MVSSQKGQPIDAELVNDEATSVKATPVPPAPTESVTGQFERKGFQAETLKLLDIVTHSLYSDKDVFIRELISNCSDALEKVRQLMSIGKQVRDEGQELEIRISAVEESRQLIVEDFGCGMSKEELVDNLGTIARSGTQGFLETMKKSGKTDLQNIIGQFGVGFYSVFMVADSVTVYSQSHDPAGSRVSLFRCLID